MTADTLARAFGGHRPPLQTSPIERRRSRKRAVWKAPLLGAISPDTVKEIYTLADLQSAALGKAKPPVRLGVLGHPVAHSLSPQMQNAALAESNLKMQYARFDIAPDQVQQALELLPQLDFVGVNLTVPHKV